LAQVTIVIEALECQQFILFFDPALEALEDSVMVTIDPNEEQALVLPSTPDYDLKFKDAYWSSWEVGTMGRPEGEAISYDVLAVGRTASCQIDRGEIPFPIQGIFNSARRI